jgi:zinc D-Ala-D-Ala carboxypeptidase
MNWSLYPNFSEAEFRCRHTGKCLMHPDFMARLQQLRTVYGRPMRISSGYRDRTHPVEARKATTGAHTMGRAADIAVEGWEAMRLVQLAVECGFSGIGVQQKGSGRFIHVDDVPSVLLPRPAMWSY